MDRLEARAGLLPAVRRHGAYLCQPFSAFGRFNGESRQPLLSVPCEFKRDLRRRDLPAVRRFQANRALNRRQTLQPHIDRVGPRPARPNSLRRPEANGNRRSGGQGATTLHALLVHVARLQGSAQGQGDAFHLHGRLGPDGVRGKRFAPASLIAVCHVPNGFSRPMHGGRLRPLGRTQTVPSLADLFDFPSVPTTDFDPNILALNPRDSLKIRPGRRRQQGFIGTERGVRPCRRLLGLDEELQLESERLCDRHLKQRRSASVAGRAGRLQPAHQRGDCVRRFIHAVKALRIGNSPADRVGQSHIQPVKKRRFLLCRSDLRGLQLVVPQRRPGALNGRTGAL